jgi:hypothetical protein
MPFVQSPGGGTFNPEAPVGVLTVDPKAPSNFTALSEQPRTPAQIAEENSVQVKALPNPIRTAADLPSNAKPGQFFTSRSNASALYVMGYDGVWRAVALVTLS